MKKLTSGMGSPELGLIRSRLEGVGIACELLDEQVAQTFHSAAFPVELWIIDDAQFPRASSLWRSWQSPADAEGTIWTCPTCGEASPAQFSSCERCGVPEAPNGKAPRFTRARRATSPTGPLPERCINDGGDPVRPGNPASHRPSTERMHPGETR